MKRLLIMAAVAAGLALPAAPALATDCEPGYQPCLPAGKDLDCSDIPDHKKPVTVTGDDQWRLDRDGDGKGCETDEFQPAPDPAEPEQGEGDDEGVTGGRLPVTGPTAVPIALAGAGLVAAGGAGVWVFRRRRIRFQA